MKTMDLSIKRIRRFIRQALQIIRTRFSTQEVFRNPANREALQYAIQKRLPEKDMKVVYPHALAAVEAVADTRVLEALKQKFPNVDIDERPTGLYLSELDFDGQYPRTAVWGQYLTSLRDSETEALAKKITKYCINSWSEYHGHCLTNILSEVSGEYVLLSTLSYPKTMQFAVRLYEFAAKMEEFVLANYPVVEFIEKQNEEVNLPDILEDVEFLKKLDGLVNVRVSDVNHVVERFEAWQPIIMDTYKQMKELSEWSSNFKLHDVNALSDDDIIEGMPEGNRDDSRKLCKEDDKYSLRNRYFDDFCRVEWDCFEEWFEGEFDEKLSDVLKSVGRTSTRVFSCYNDIKNAENFVYYSVDEWDVADDEFVIYILRMLAEGCDPAQAAALVFHNDLSQSMTDPLCEREAASPKDVLAAVEDAVNIYKKYTDSYIKPRQGVMEYEEDFRTSRKEGFILRVAVYVSDYMEYNS